MFIEIDITISDALKRRYQCATIQLDFNLPIQFKLSYRTGESGEGKDPEHDRARPVMIHRAILGSVERFTAILTEHFGGKWCVTCTTSVQQALRYCVRRPFWISPRQAIVVPVAATHKAYAQEVMQNLWDSGIYAEVDLTDSTLNKKIVRTGDRVFYDDLMQFNSMQRNAEVSQNNFILSELTYFITYLILKLYELIKC